MLTADENYRLLMEIQANRDAVLQAYRQNPELLKHAEPRVRLLFGLPENEEDAEPSTQHIPTTPDHQRK